MTGIRSQSGRVASAFAPATAAVGSPRATPPRRTTRRTPPHLPADVRLRAHVLVGWAVAMGLVAPTLELQTATDDAALWIELERVAAAARARGVGVLPSSILRSDAGHLLDADAVRTAVDQLADALEGSPIPSAEIPELARTLGWPALVGMIGASEVSLRRYAKDQRATPDDLAGRIHWLALVVADLRGGYNDFGVRRWIERPRPQLDGRRPIDILTGDWTPDDPDVRRVRALAAWVAQPTPAT